MTRILTSILVFIIFATYGQKDAISIYGKISDRDDSKKQIFALKARLSLNDSLFIVTDCDSSGNYKFQISKSLIKLYRPTVWVYQDFKLLQKLFPPPIDCPFNFGGPDQYLSTRSIPVEIKDKISNYEVNFTLTKVTVCYRFPSLCFKKSSTDFITCYNDPSGDTVLFCIKNLLTKNPTIVLELVAHAWDEENPKDLSLKRAGFVKQKLISLGVDSVRLKIKGYADTRPLVEAKVIRSAKSAEEKEALKSKNRQAGFLILSWEYDPKLKKIVTSDKPTPTDDGEE